MIKRLLLYLVIVSILIFSGCIITGKVVDENGAGVSGVTVTLSGNADMPTITDSNGKYRFGTLDNMLSAGSYTVTPSRTGDNFSPVSKNVTITNLTLEGLGDIPGAVGDVNFNIDSIPAASFDSTSYILTNIYFPMKVGDQFVQSGYGGWDGLTVIFEALGTEAIGSVTCLKVNYTSTDGDYYTLWLAQDTLGNVWLLKIYDNDENDSYTFGRGNGINYPFMTSTPRVGDRVSHTFPEPEDLNPTHGFSEISAIGVTVPQLSTGLGPFTNCIEIKCYQTYSQTVEVEYYCPDIGGVKDYNDPPGDESGKELESYTLN